MSKSKASRQRIIKTFYAPYPREVCRQLLWKNNDRLRKLGLEIEFSPTSLTVHYSVGILRRMLRVFLPGSISVLLWRIGDRATEITVAEHLSSKYLEIFRIIAELVLLSVFASDPNAPPILTCIVIPFLISASIIMLYRISERYTKKKFIDHVIAILGSDDKYQYFEPEVIS